MRNRAWPVAHLLVCLCVLLPIRRAVAQEAKSDAQSVREAIRWGVQILRERQARDGRWPLLTTHDTTSLCTLALLNAGVPVKSSTIQAALGYLRKKPLLGTYEVALECMVFCAATPKKDLEHIRKRAAWLVNKQVRGGRQRGMWTYGRLGSGDNSNSQFALLGLYEADRVFKREKQPSPIPAITWQMALDHWVGAQNDDGSWGYAGKGSSGYGSMTCAGIASVIIASGRLHGSTAAVQGARVTCCGGKQQDKAAVAVAKAIAWLGAGKRFDVRSHPGHGKLSLYYYLYALERVGRLTAQRKIAGRDWYREGAKFLAIEQDPRFRGWKNDNRGHGENETHIATSYALLFLAKGRRPVLIGKLRHGDDGDWNNHPSDTASLTQYVEQKWKRDLSYYVVEGSSATADDLAHSPVIYLSGSKSLSFMQSAVRRAKMAKAVREYIDRGGFVYAEACCDDSAAFDASFRAFMGSVFPERDKYELQAVEAEHEIWIMEEEIKAKQKGMYLGRLEEIRKGCRTCVVYCGPGRAADRVPSPSCYWELAAGLGRDGKLPAPIQLEVDTAFKLGINILAYATGRKLKFKYEDFDNGNQPENFTLTRAVLDIRQLRHNGGWNAAPHALVQLQKKLNAHAGIPVPTDRREIDVMDPKIFDHHMLFMHGRNAFSFTDKQREQLRMYVERGNVIFADAVCASEAFARSFRTEMNEIFKGKRPLKPIPPDHKLFTMAYGGFDLKTKPVTLRLPPRTQVQGQPLKAVERQGPPELEGIQFKDGRYGVIFSKYDLSCALEGHEGAKCPGYSREDAARIGVNVVLYTLQE